MRKSSRILVAAVGLGLVFSMSFAGAATSTTGQSDSSTETTIEDVVAIDYDDPYVYLERIIPDARDTVTLQFVKEAGCGTGNAAGCAHGERQAIEIDIDSWRGASDTISQYILIHEATHLAQWRYFGSWEGASVALDEEGYGTTHARDGVTLLPSIEVHADCVALHLLEDLTVAGYINRCDPWMAYYGFTLVTGNGQLRGE